MTERYQIRSEHDPEAWNSHYALVRGFIDEQWEMGVGDGISIEGWGKATDRRYPHARTNIGFRNNPRYVNLREYVGISRGEATLIDARVEVPTGFGKAIYNGNHRFEGTFRDPFAPSSTEVMRRDKNGKSIYHHEFKNPRAPELISRLIMKKIVRARLGEEDVAYE